MSNLRCWPSLPRLGILQQRPQRLEHPRAIELRRARRHNRAPAARRPRARARCRTTRRRSRCSCSRDWWSRYRTQTTRRPRQRLEPARTAAPNRSRSRSCAECCASCRRVRIPGRRSPLRCHGSLRPARSSRSGGLGLRRGDHRGRRDSSCCSRLRSSSRRRWRAARSASAGAAHERRPHRSGSARSLRMVASWRDSCRARQAGAQVVAHLAGDLADVREQAVERAVLA